MSDNSTPETATHYHTHNIEDQPIIKMMRENSVAEFKAYLRINARKYELRQGRKEGTDDHKKRVQYLAWYQEFSRMYGITLLGQFIPKFKDI